MGILAMNIAAFADVPAAYLNPLAATPPVRSIDLVLFGVNFIAVDGKMRGLFSFLFGASLLLFADRVEDRGDSATRLVIRRQLWLLLFGWAHFTFIWYGDILVGYALIGLVAFLFRKRSTRTLIASGVALILLQLLVMSGSAYYAVTLWSAVQSSPTPDILAQWQGLDRDMGIPSAARLQETLALYRGGWVDLVHHQLTEKPFYPLIMTLMFGPETLGLMLLGMAGLKSGLLTGAWSDRRLWRWALVCLGIAVPAYLLLLGGLVDGGYRTPAILLFGFAGTVPFRPLMVVGYACLIILATRRNGWLTRRIAAAGRAAFTNYLGTSIVMTTLFYGWGLGLFGMLGRAELALVTLVTWAGMLLWSKPWLDRYRYGPLEWLWRSLTNGRSEPMRRTAIA